MSITEDPITVPLTGDTKMPNESGTANQGLAQELIGQGMAALSGIAQVAQANFVTVNKVVDYDFMEGKRMIGLDEAVGVREVASKNVPAGPTSV